MASHFNHSDARIFAYPRECSLAIFADPCTQVKHSVQLSPAAKLLWRADALFCFLYGHDNMLAGYIFSYCMGQEG